MRESACAIGQPRKRTRENLAFTPAGPRVLPYRVVIIIWTATSGPHLMFQSRLLSESRDNVVPRGTS